jgi:hypothetical protein
MALGTPIAKARLVMKAIYLLALLGTPLLFTNCDKTRLSGVEAKRQAATVGDVSFARSTFESLTRGDSSVAEKIDWAVFTSLGENLGATYVSFASGVEKEKFVAGYISQFATSFRESGGSVDSFTNWRVVSHDSQKTEVAADGNQGVLTIVVSERDGIERVSSINVVK